MLLAEEEESFSDVLAYMLRRQGFEVAVCTSGRQTLDQFDSSGADLVLLGLALSGPPAAQVCRGLRSRSNVPVIMLTANETLAGKAVAYEFGADGYVTVPFAWRELLACIRAVLSPGYRPPSTAIAMRSSPGRRPGVIEVTNSAWTLLLTSSLSSRLNCERHVRHVMP